MKSKLIVLVAFIISQSAYSQQLKKLKTDLNSHQIFNNKDLMIKATMQHIDTEVYSNSFTIKVNKLLNKTNNSITSEAKDTSSLKTVNDYPKFALFDLNEKSYKFKDIENKELVFNFWLIDRASSIMENPKLSKLVEKYRNNNGAVFLKVKFDKKESILSFLKNEINDDDTEAIEENDLIQELNINGFPAYVILDKKNILLNIFISFEEITLHRLEVSISTL